MKRLLVFISIVSLITALSSCGNSSRGEEMTCVLEISDADLLRSLSNNYTRAEFDKALGMAQQQKDSGNKSDVISLFTQAYRTAFPKGKMALMFKQSELTIDDSMTTVRFTYPLRFQGHITDSSSDEQVTAALKMVRRDLLRHTAQVLDRRFRERPKAAVSYRQALKDFFKKDNFDESNMDETLPAAADVSIINDSSQISVGLYRVIDVSRVRALLTRRCKLEFWDTYENEELYADLIHADKALGEKVTAGKLKVTLPAPKVQADTPKTEKDFFEGAVVDSNKKVAKPKKVSVSRDSIMLTHPLAMVLSLMADSKDGLYPGPMIGASYIKDTAKVGEYFAMDFVKSCFPRDLKLLWGEGFSGDKAKAFMELYAIKVNSGLGEAPLSGDAIVDAWASKDKFGEHVRIRFNAQDTYRWGQLTAAAANGRLNGNAIHRCIVVAVDDQVIAAPKVMAKIGSGYTEITYKEGAEQTVDLSAMLRAGPLPAAVRIVAMHPATAK